MTKPWVVIAAGVASLLVIGIAVRQRSSSDTPQVTGAGQRGRADDPFAKLESKGWTAKEDSADVGSSGGGTRPASTRPGRAGGGIAGAASQTGGAAGERGAATIVRGAAGQRPGIGSIPGSTLSSSGAIRVDSNAPEVTLPFDNAKRLGGGAQEGHASTEVRQVAAGSQTDASGQSKDKADDPNADPNQPVLELSFDKTTQPEKGDTAPIVEKGVSFDSGQGAVFSTDSQFAVPDAGNIKGEAGTIAFQIQPQWDGTDPTSATLVNLQTPNQWEDRLHIKKEGDSLRFMFFDNTGAESGLAAKIDSWQPQEWHQVTATWGPSDQGGNQIAFFVDGHQVGTQQYDGEFQVPNQPLYIGSNYNDEHGAKAALSNFQVYSRALGPSEVSNLASSATH